MADRFRSGDGISGNSPCAVRSDAQKSGENKKEKNLHKAGFNYVNYIALVTLPDLMHLVHTFFLVTVPFSSTFTV